MIKIISRFDKTMGLFESTKETLREAVIEAVASGG